MPLMSAPSLSLRVQFVAILVLTLSGAAIAAPAVDGPYLIWESGHWVARSVAGVDAAPKILEQRLRPRDSFTVASVGSMPSFSVRVREREVIAPDAVKLARSTPLFVIADTHGQYEILGELLRKQRIVDDQLRWSFGKGHVVVLGDVFDRGPNQIEILWLFYELQAQAAEKGGGFHLLLGNHEAMVLGGDLRYLNPRYHRTVQALGVASYSQLVAANTLLGQWLRTRPAVLRIGDSLCLHGGVSPELVQRRLGEQQINATVRDVLNGAALDAQVAQQASFLMGPLGPLWYRGYFADSTDRPATLPEVEQMLAHFNVARILVGHTRVPAVTTLYGRRIVAVQVYPHLDEQSGAPVMEGLRIDGDRLRRARIDGSLQAL
jgi:hypothetical protein